MLNKNEETILFWLQEMSFSPSSLNNYISRFHFKASVDVYCMGNAIPVCV